MSLSLCLSLKEHLILQASPHGLGLSFGGLGVVALLTWRLISKRQEVKVFRKLRVMLGTGTASLSLNSINQRSHRACSDSRGWRNRLYLLMEVGEVTLQKCTWNRRYCCSSLWKIHSATVNVVAKELRLWSQTAWVQILSLNHLAVM